MKFCLVDKINSIETSEDAPRHQRIVTVKALSLAEEYLADHFPAFPVLPGVLMLEAMVQSAAWLVRLEQNWARSMVVLGEARNVRYASFVRPGQMLRCEVTAKSIGDDISKFQATAMIDEAQAVSARLALRSFNLRDRQGYLAEADERIVADLRERFKLARGPEALTAASTAPG
ncbi:MAG: beta-hydroxyacyl-ACP dehydratase [Phycisphaerae bacterium]|nr:beta-hydroxyacyl-ACP dehydratase [Phycisphaerae bacterium]